jgi:hypothetical protein
MMYFLVFAAAFTSVFMLGLSSKLIRDDKIAASALVSWGITVAQYAMTWAVFEAGLDPAEYILCSGAGGSLGITSLQHFYLWMRRREYV